MTWALLMSSPRHRTFLLSSATIDALNEAANVAGVAPSTIITHLVAELQKFGVHRIQWPGKAEKGR